jgi:hypothetical protein
VLLHEPKKKKEKKKRIGEEKVLQSERRKMIGTAT